MAERGLILSTVQLPFVRRLGAFGSLRKVSLVDAECNACSKREADEQHDAGVDEKFPHVSFLIVGLTCIATCCIACRRREVVDLESGTPVYFPVHLPWVPV
jgi:hypothetical protein